VDAQTDKDLFRKDPSLCPACKSPEIHLGNIVPYYKTHQKWGTDIDTYKQVVPQKYQVSVFEIYYCKNCEFVYVPASYKDIVQIIEEHPLYPERIIRPYLMQTQKYMDKDYSLKILTSSNSPDTVDQRYNKMRSLILSHMGNEESFIDLGSNYGSFAEFIRITCPGIKVSGCEINQHFIRECRRRYPDLHLIEEKLSENKIIGPFDFIYCCDILEHLWDIDEFLTSVKKHLTSIGKIMVITPNLDCIESKVRGAEWWAFIVPHHAQIFNIKSLVALMNRHGFSLIESEPILEEFYAIFKSESCI
jgi:2-polyprenyl-3-methyl-5-hydroxy-6-metoxy-1,4-benzoquinol methylase